MSCVKCKLTDNLNTIFDRNICNNCFDKLKTSKLCKKGVFLKYNLDEDDIENVDYTMYRNKYRNYSYAYEELDVYEIFLNKYKDILKTNNGDIDEIEFINDYLLKNKMNIKLQKMLKKIDFDIVNLPKILIDDFTYKNDIKNINTFIENYDLINEIRNDDIIIKKNVDIDNNILIIINSLENDDEYDKIIDYILKKYDDDVKLKERQKNIDDFLSCNNIEHKIKNEYLNVINNYINYGITNDLEQIKKKIIYDEKTIIKFKVNKMIRKKIIDNKIKELNIKEIDKRIIDDYIDEKIQFDIAINDIINYSWLVNNTNYEKFKGKSYCYEQYDKTALTLEEKQKINSINKWIKKVSKKGTPPISLNNIIIKTEMYIIIDYKYSLKNITTYEEFLNTNLKFLKRRLYLTKDDKIIENIIKNNVQYILPNLIKNNENILITNFTYDFSDKNEYLSIINNQFVYLKNIFNLNDENYNEFIVKIIHKIYVNLYDNKATDIVKILLNNIIINENDTIDTIINNYFNEISEKKMIKSLIYKNSEGICKNIISKINYNFQNLKLDYETIYVVSKNCSLENDIRYNYNYIIKLFNMENYVYENIIITKAHEIKKAYRECFLGSKRCKCGNIKKFSCSMNSCFNCCDDLSCKGHLTQHNLKIKYKSV